MRVTFFVPRPRQVPAQARRAAADREETALLRRHVATRCPPSRGTSEDGACPVTNTSGATPPCALDLPSGVQTLQQPHTAAGRPPANAQRRGHTRPWPVLLVGVGCSSTPKPESPPRRLRRHAERPHGSSPSLWRSSARTLASMSAFLVRTSPASTCSRCKCAWSPPPLVGRGNCSPANVGTWPVLSFAQTTRALLLLMMSGAVSCRRSGCTCTERAPRASHGPRVAGAEASKTYRAERTFSLKRCGSCT